MQDTITIAVVGAGYWGPNLTRNVAKLPGVLLHTVCDIDESRLKTMQREFRPQHITTNIEQVIHNPEIHGIILATPAHTHAELAKKALQAGKHTFVEKPLALNAADARELVELASKMQRHLMVGHVFVYNPAVRKLKELVDNGEVGKVLYIYSQRVNLGQIRDDLNAFWNLAPHDISIVNYLLGAAPRSVSARGFNFLQPDKHLEDVVFAVLEYPGGTAAHIHTSWLDPNKIRRTTIVGDKKMVVYDDVSDNRLTIYDKGAIWKAEADYGLHRLMTYTGDVVIPRISVAEPLQLEVQHFVDCIRTGQKPLTDGVDGLNVVRVLEAVDESLKQGGKVVTLA